MSHRNEVNRSARGIQVLVAALVAVAMMFGGLSTAVASDDIKIGYVDLHRALEESQEGQALKSELEQEFQQRQQRLDQQQEEVMKLRSDLEQQAMMLSDEARQQKGMELQQKMGELQETYLTLQNELAQQEAAATQELFGKMESVIESIGEEKGFTMILESQDVLFSVDGLDLTDELIERFDAQN